MTFSPSTWQQQSNTTWRNKPNSFCPENFSRCCAIHIFISEGQHVLCIFACCVLCACIWFVNGWRKKEITTGRQVTMWQLHRLPSNSIASKVRRSGHKQGRRVEEREKRPERDKTWKELLLKDNKQITGESLRIPVYTVVQCCVPFRDCVHYCVTVIHRWGVGANPFERTISSELRRLISYCTKRKILEMVEKRKNLDWGASTVSEAHNTSFCALRQLSIIRPKRSPSYRDSAWSYTHVIWLTGYGTCY